MPPVLSPLPLCPSARPEMDGAVVFGVMGGEVDAPLMTTLAEPVPVSAALLELAAPADPTEVFRFSAPCATHQCQHYDGKDCQLAARIVELVIPVMESLPACSIRPTCQWWLQEGREACMRCPQIVSSSYGASEELALAAKPTA